VAIRYMRFECLNTGPIHMVGTDPDAMRVTARRIDSTADPRGEEINSERVLAAITTDRQRALFEAGVAAAKSGDTDFYIFG
jgi:hypothetical protein